MWKERESNRAYSVVVPRQFGWAASSSFNAAGGEVGGLVDMLREWIYETGTVK
jgi:hypothetical protein